MARASAAVYVFIMTTDKVITDGLVVTSTAV